MPCVFQSHGLLGECVPIFVVVLVSEEDVHRLQGSLKPPLVVISLLHLGYVKQVMWLSVVSSLTGYVKKTSSASSAWALTLVSYRDLLLEHYSNGYLLATHCTIFRDYIIAFQV